jgi:PAS domain S-box-containing protein
MLRTPFEAAVLRDELLRDALDHLPIGVVIFEPDDPTDPRSLKLSYANRSCRTLAGMDVHSTLGQRLLEAFPDPNAKFREALAGVLRDRQPRDLGSLRSESAPLKGQEFRVRLGPVGEHGVALYFENLTQQHAEFRELNLFLDSIIEDLPAMIFMKDAAELRFVRFNRAGEELLGLKREDLMGKNDHDFFPKEQADFFTAKDREVLASGKVLDIPEEPIQTPRGERWLHTRKIPVIDVSGRPTHLLGVSIDITEARRASQLLKASHEELEKAVSQRTDELRRTEEQLRQSQKMEAIGRLAGGIAHDFNNLLTVILGNADLALDLQSAEGPLRDAISGITRAGRRASDLTRQLLAFARRQVLEPKVLDLNELLSSLQDLLGRLLGEDIRVSVDADPALAPVLADPTHLTQVIMNLVVNARDAMPRGGRLLISTTNADLGLVEAAACGLKPGPYVRLEVADSGKGMDPETLTRIFEPFYTTKQPGHGTGLGLSTALGIVEQSGGAIRVSSEPGKGATFSVFLPRHGGTAAPAPAEAARLNGGGSESLLLAEDEDEVRKVTARILRQRGYQVTEAVNGEQALRMAAAMGDALDLLVTDVVMPGMGGRELAAQLRAQRKGLKVLFVSGYTDDVVLQHGGLENGLYFLQKPFSTQELTQKVRKILDGEA